MSDQFSEYYQEHLSGAYDCVDRIVLTAYNPFIQDGGGFRTWWRISFGGDDKLDNTHLMRFPGHFSRKLRAFLKKQKIPLVYCEAKERKDEIAEKYFPRTSDFTGVFCVLVNRAPASVLEVKRTGKNGMDIRKKKPFPYVYHYSFHIMDAQWGHVIIRFCPHPPFNAMIILNGHEYVERQALTHHIPFTKEDNCFTIVPNAAALKRIADTMTSSDGGVGRLFDVCERWIYSSCLCFALETSEQQRTNFRYAYSVFQAEYSRNLLFTYGDILDKVFNGVIDRTRAPLDVRTIKTIFGYQRRVHYRDQKGKKPRIQVTVEKPVYDLTVFKINFGRLTVKMYSKGERVLRIEAIAHNTADLRCGKRLEKFPEIIAMLASIVEEFLGKLRCIDVSFVHAEMLETWHKPAILGKSKTAGVDINNPRLRAVMEALIALSISPQGITTKTLALKVGEIMGDERTTYTPRRAAYDLKKFRGKGIVTKAMNSRTYAVTEDGLRSMTAYIVLRDKVLIPLLSRAGKRRPGVKKMAVSCYESHCENIQVEMQKIFNELSIAA